MSKPYLVTFDIESYYGTRCNIKALGVSQYVAHPEFEVLCLGYKTPKMGQARMLRGDQIHDFFERLKKAQSQGHRVVLCAHNMPFDGYVAYYHYGFIPDFYLCTLSMARPIYGEYMPLDLNTLAEHFELGEKVPDVLSKWRNVRWEDASPEMRKELLHYGRIDVELGEALLKKLVPNFPRPELKVIDLTIRMFTEPVIEADAELAQTIIDSEKKLKREALDAVGVEHATTVRSNDRFAELLEERGYEVPLKWSEKQEKEVPAFAQADLPFQRMRDSDDEDLAALVHARLVNNTSIDESRAGAIIQRSNAPVPIGLNYCGAHTMRWSGTDKFNPQNLPREGDLRRCLRAPEGYRFVIADAAQIEARDNATFSGQWDLVEEFAAGVDVYASFASDLYGFEVNKDDHPDTRFVGKTGILSLQYQSGWCTLQQRLATDKYNPLEITDEEAQRVVNLYRQKYYKIKQTWKDMQNMLSVLLPGNHQPVEFNGLLFKPGGSIEMPNGLSLHYPGMDFQVGDYGNAEFTYMPWSGKYKKYIVEKLYGGKSVENTTQCRSRIMTTEHMMELSRFYRVVMMAHDEIVMCVPENKAEACLKDALEVMAIPPRWNEKCPLEAEGKITKEYVK